MKTSSYALRLIGAPLILWSVWFLSLTQAGAATVVSGNVSGVWRTNDDAQGTNVSRPVFINNTVFNAASGVSIAKPNFDPIVHNNLFVRTTHALFNLGGSAGLDVSHNCFFGNAANFVGYPGIYGLPVQKNQNGDLSDAFFNIFLDPQCIDTNRFLIRNSSPCVDGGDPTTADECFHFSHGSAISDIGAYGGPDVCRWITNDFAPILTVPPFDQASCVGGTAVFKVRVEGSEPLSYQWRFKDTLLMSETNAVLSLANLGTNQAGPYTLTASNAFGSVTSMPVRLVLSDACFGIHLYAGLSITGIVGRTYTIEAATDPSATQWLRLATNTFTESRWLFVDTNTPVIPWRYFRVRLQP